MRVPTDKILFCLIFSLLLHSLQSVAGYRNNTKPVPITYHKAQSAEEASTTGERCDESPEIASVNTEQCPISQDKVATNAVAKQKYLMDAITQCHWDNFEWVELRHHLFHYMFNLKNTVWFPIKLTDDNYPVFMALQRYKVQFLEMTKGRDGAKIINNITVKIMETSHLPEHEAFFLIFEAILNHIPAEERAVHPNGIIIEQLEQVSLNYDGENYQPPVFDIQKDEIVQFIITNPQKYFPADIVMKNAAIMNTQLANVPDVLAQLLAFDTGLAQPDSTKNSDTITAAAFINAYPAKDQFQVLTWLVSKRFDYVKTMEGGFYQGETRLRNIVKAKMRGQHCEETQRTALALLAINYFGFNYLTDDDTTIRVTANSDPLYGFAIRQNTRLRTHELKKLAHIPDICNNLESISRQADFYTGCYLLTRGFRVLGAKEAYLLLAKIRAKHKAKTISLLTAIFKELNLTDALIQLRNIGYVPVDSY
ncbi:MAG: hypothetical protein OXC48_08220 [Endozoicomonadaceae bacterium]|nr:hypothetical protein [Endozoicomonadaceae bacterium]